MGREEGERRPEVMEVFVVENAGALDEAMDEPKTRREEAGSLSGIEMYLEENLELRVEVAGDAG